MCAICSAPISVNPDDETDKGYHFGEQAHIAGEKPGAARHNPKLIPEEVNSYANILLLCPTCHTKIDKDPDTYTVDKLHFLKSAHERKVLDKLTELNNPLTDPSIEDKLYMHLIDETVRLANLLDWERWTSLFVKSYGALPSTIYEGVCSLDVMVASCVWPGTDPELEKSIQSFTIFARAMVDCFMEHSKIRVGQPFEEPVVYEVDRFYKASFFTSEKYEELLDKFNKWEQAREGLLIEAICSLNWFADSVRTRLDPTFFSLHGKFKYETEMTMDLTTYIRIPEYEAQNKIDYPDQSRNRINEILFAYKSVQ